ncbi:MAG TPA: CHASE2 domain-containing protein, partial [Gammaproteobacteria bacterium]|nr:CHASE2 domain-containing protein [Gammaproteobacteria bacterium]
MALGIALVGLITLAAPPFADLEAKLGLQLLFRLRGPISPPPEVVVVTIDQESSQQLALPNLPRKWPRRRH